jgi:hypothetical protein
MIKNIFLISILCSLNVFSLGSSAEPISVSSPDTINIVLSAHIGKRVSIKTKSGGEMTGKVISVSEKLTHLGKLAGKEFYDAVIVNKHAEAIVVRVK